MSSYHGMALVLLALVLLALALGGCDSRPRNVQQADALDSKIGDNCIVQFRRGDALGAAATSHPFSPTADNIGGVNTQISGTLTALDGDWLILKQDKMEIWIPRSSILIVEFPVK